MNDPFSSSKRGARRTDINLRQKILMPVQNEGEARTKKPLALCAKVESHRDIVRTS